MEKFIQEKLNMVLIDKVTIAGLSIRKIIDEERLFKKGVLSISGKTKKICIRKKDFPAFCKRWSDVYTSFIPFGRLSRVV